VRDTSFLLLRFIARRKRDNWDNARKMREELIRWLTLLLRKLHGIFRTSGQLINYRKEEKELQFPTYRDSFHRCRKRALTGTSGFHWRIKRLKFGLHTFLRHLWNREYRFPQSAIARLRSPHMHVRDTRTHLPTSPSIYLAIYPFATSGATSSSGARTRGRYS